MRIASDPCSINILLLRHPKETKVPLNMLHLSAELSKKTKTSALLVCSGDAINMARDGQSTRVTQIVNTIYDFSVA